MATAEDMAIRTTWLFSLEIEKAAERFKDKSKIHIVTFHSTYRKLTTQGGAAMIVEVMSACHL